MKTRLTPAMQLVVDKLRELGGIAYLCSGIDKSGLMRIEMGHSRRHFGKAEYNRYRNRLKRLKVSTTKGVWCSNATLLKLRQAGVVEPVELLPAVWRLTKEFA